MVWVINHNSEESMNNNKQSNIKSQVYLFIFQILKSHNSFISG